MWLGHKKIVAMRAKKNFGREGLQDLMKKTKVCLTLAGRTWMGFTWIAHWRKTHPAQEIRFTRDLPICGKKHAFSWLNEPPKDGDPCSRRSPSIGRKNPARAPSVPARRLVRYIPRIPEFISFQIPTLFASERLILRQKESLPSCRSR